MTSKTVSFDYLLQQHRKNSDNIMKSDLSTEQKLSNITMLNLTIEDTLMSHNRYRGFQFANAGYRKMLQDNKKPGNDAYWKLLDMYHYYY